MMTARSRFLSAPATISDADAEPPVVLAGDLNVYPEGSRAIDAEEWEMFESVGLVDSWVEAGETPAFTAGQSDDLDNVPSALDNMVDFVLHGDDTHIQAVNGSGHIAGEELDDRRRASMLDESLEILAAAWSGEPVHHRGEHYTVDSMRFLPRPVQRPGVPVWVAGYYGKSRPLRRAIRYQGFFPVGLEHPDQLAEISADLRRLGRETGDGAAEPFDVAVELEPGSDPAPYAAAGATWGLVAFPWNPVSVDQVRGVIREGPAPP